jgi:ribosomal protein L7Ae-like RNA K-turn-binding protein
MNSEKITQAILMLADVLMDDPKAEKIFNKIDLASNDSQIKEGIREAITYLNACGKNAIAEQVKANCSGWL